MAAKNYSACPQVGMIVTFSPSASSRLAGIPGTVRQVIAHLQNGDVLLTLEYDRPVKLGDVLMTHVDALASEVIQIEGLAERAVAA